MKGRVTFLGYLMELWYVYRYHFYLIRGISIFLRKSTIGLFVKRGRVGVIVSVRRLSVYLITTHYRALHYKIRNASLLNKFITY